MTPVVLARGDYYELRARIRDAEVLEVDLLKAVATYDRLRREADARVQACYERLAAAYGFDPTVTYGWNDDACALVPQDKENGDDGRGAGGGGGSAGGDGAAAVGVGGPEPA